MPCIARLADFQELISSQMNCSSMKINLEITTEENRSTHSFLTFEQHLMNGKMKKFSFYCEENG